MLYTAYQAQSDLINPARMLAQTARGRKRAGAVQDHWRAVKLPGAGRAF